MMRKVRFYDYLTESWVERYEETDPSKIEYSTVPAEEFIRINTAPGSIRTFSELSPEEQREYAETMEDEEDEDT